MLLNIKHTSRYQYDYPVQYAVQRLRLHPSSSPGQKVIDWNVTVSGAEQEASYRDGYGNRTQLVRLDREVKELVIEATGQVETEDRSGVLGKVYNFMPIWLYERETELTKPGDAIKQLAASLKVTNDRLAVMHELMTTLHKVVAYTPGTTNITTTAEEALTLGTGVCQDHTHVFLAVARVLKIPARYVSGYLMMLDSIEQTATHAWAEAHIDGLGWVGFDAANDICPNEHYIRIACGLDYNEASPISGMRFGPGMESLAVDLNVEQ